MFNFGEVYSQLIKEGDGTQNIVNDSQEFSCACMNCLAIFFLGGGELSVK